MLRWIVDTSSKPSEEEFMSFMECFCRIASSYPYPEANFFSGLTSIENFFCGLICNWLSRCNFLDLPTLFSEFISQISDPGYIRPVINVLRYIWL